MRSKLIKQSLVYVQVWPFQWGPIGDVGVLHEMVGGDLKFSGLLPQPINSCMAVMDYCLSQKQPIVSSFVKSSQSSTQDSKDKRDLVQSVVRILGVKDPSKMNPSVSLGELGIDSLMSIEVKQLLERDYDVTLPLQEIRQLTVIQIKEIGDSCSGNSPASETSATAETGLDQETQHLKRKENGRLSQDLLITMCEHHREKNYESAIASTEGSHGWIFFKD
ncbi:hypothetical protein MTO96_052252 [Rhipicephalus appendiculatus]